MKERKFHFLRFVIVLLKILAVFWLLAGVAAVVFGFLASPLGAGQWWGQTLGWVTIGGGVAALLVGLSYFVALWGLADLIRVRLRIEENTRGTAEALASLDLAPVFSAEEVGQAVASALDARLAAPEARLVQEASVEAVEAGPEAARVTVAKKAVVAEPATVEVAAVAETIEETVPEGADEISAEAAALAEPAAAEVAAAAEAIEEAVSEGAEEISAEVAAVAEPAATEVAAVVEAVEEAVPEGADELSAEVAAVAEPVAAEPVEEAVPEGAEELSAELAVVAEPVAAEAAAAAEAVEEAAEEVVQLESLPAEESADLETARLRAKESLDRSLEEAARQMAELEAAPAEPVEAATEESVDNLGEISGIGPVFRIRLRQAGIRTFAELAALTPEDLAAITEQSVERIERDDWIGQAEQRLAVG